MLTTNSYIISLSQVLPAPTAVPLKQRLLERWRERQTDLSLQTTPRAVPVNNTTNTSSSSSSGVDYGVAPSSGLPERQPSPLFEEFSDSEFDSVREEREKEEEEEEGVTEVTETWFGGTSGHDNPTPRVSDVATPVSRDGQSERGVVNDVITVVGAGQKGGERVGDTREGTAKSETVEKTEIVRKTRSLEELMSEDMGSVGRGEGEEGEGARKEGRSGGKSLEELMVMDIAISGGGELGGEGGVRRGGEGDGAMFASTDPREAAGQQQSLAKTPVKRKVRFNLSDLYLIRTISLIPISLQINLSEYRSRARKPPAAEPRKDSSSSDTFTPSHLSSSPYSLLPTPSGGALMGEALPPPPPQFEPVSPDDSEPAPLHSEGLSCAHSLNKGTFLYNPHTSEYIKSVEPLIMETQTPLLYLPLCS